MKTLITILLLSILVSSNAQSVDTVIYMKGYTSYFNNQLHEPLYVTYKLYKGGGNCSRNKDKFETGGLAASATASDYEGHGYDEGHLANSKDFAYDCKLQEQTFRFYNCVPQTPKLNRGTWKVLETELRKESQTDSLYIIAGSIFGNKKIGKAAVPDFCYKVVYSLSTKKILYCRLYPNDNSDSFTDINLTQLKNKIAYRLVY